MTIEDILKGIKKYIDEHGVPQELIDKVNRLYDTAWKQDETINLFVYVTALPENPTQENTNKIYLVTDPDNTSQCKEYIAVERNGGYTWEQIGTTAGNISDYSNTAEVTAAINAKFNELKGTIPDGIRYTADNAVLTKSGENDSYTDLITINAATSENAGLLTPAKLTEIGTTTATAATNSADIAAIKGKIDANVNNSDNNLIGKKTIENMIASGIPDGGGEGGSGITSEDTQALDAKIMMLPSEGTSSVKQKITTYQGTDTDTKDNKAKGDYSMSIGYNTSTWSEASYSFSGGLNTIAKHSSLDEFGLGKCAFAFGEGVETKFSYEIAFGKYNYSGVYTITDETEIEKEVRTVFSIGNGTDDNHRNNLVYVTSDGNIWYNNGENSLFDWHDKLNDIEDSLASLTPPEGDTFITKSEHDGDIVTIENKINNISKGKTAIKYSINDFEGENKASRYFVETEYSNFVDDNASDIVQSGSEDMYPVFYVEESQASDVVVFTYDKMLEYQDDNNMAWIRIAVVPPETSGVCIRRTFIMPYFGMQVMPYRYKKGSDSEKMLILANADACVAGLVNGCYTNNPTEEVNYTKITIDSMSEMCIVTIQAMADPYNVQTDTDTIIVNGGLYV